MDLYFNVFIFYLILVVRQRDRLFINVKCAVVAAAVEVQCAFGDVLVAAPVAAEVAVAAAATAAAAIATRSTAIAAETGIPLKSL